MIYYYYKCHLNDSIKEEKTAFIAHISKLLQKNKMKKEDNSKITCLSVCMNFSFITTGNLYAGINTFNTSCGQQLNFVTVT